MTEWTTAPVLTGAHVRLEPLTTDHVAGVLAAADDDEVFAWTSFARPRTLAEAAFVVDGHLCAPGVAWAQVDLASGRVAGLTTYYDVDPVRRTLAIGSTWLARRHWRTALNTEAKLLLLGRAFDELGCVRVVWHVDEHNRRSQEAVTRLGARLEGVLRKHKQRRDGSWRDTHLFSMLDTEWPAARQALEDRLRR